MEYIRQFPPFLRNFTSRSYARNILVAAMGFAAAGALGLILGVILLKSPLARGLIGLVDQTQPLQRLVLALIIFLVGMALSGVIAGGLGGWILTIVDSLAPRRRYILTGAIAFAAPQAIFTPLALIVGSLLAIYYNNIDANPAHLPILLGLFGLFYGMAAGLIFGLASVGFKYGWGVLFAAMMGGLFGGFLTGGVLRFALARMEMGELLHRWWLLLLIFMIFYGSLGMNLGLVYTWFHRARKEGGDLPSSMGRYWRIFAIIAMVMVILNLTGVFYQVFSFAMMKPASTSTVIRPETTGVAWSEPEQIGSGSPAFPPGMAASADGRLAVVWTQQGPAYSKILLRQATVDESGQPTWGEPAPLSAPERYASRPQIAADSRGNWRVVWEEADPATSGPAHIMHARCAGGECAPPDDLTAQPAPCAPNAGAASSPVIAIDDEDQTMVVWQTESGALMYATWPAAASPPSTPQCLPFTGAKPQVVAVDKGQFILAFEAQGKIAFVLYREGAWFPRPLWRHSGHDPAIFYDGGDRFYTAWCGEDGRVNARASKSYTIADPEVIDSPPCTGRPALARDGYGRLHILWQSNQVMDQFGASRPGGFLYDSARGEDGWQPAVIAARAQSPVTPAVVTDQTRAMRMAWSDADALLLQSSQPHYQCPGSAGSPYGDAILNALRTDPYRPPGSAIPFCGNHFLGLYMQPNPPGADAGKEKPDAAFDEVAAQIRSARYEVDFATMEWMKDEAMDSPGFIFAQAVADLYDKVKANPENYPRGVTVRILLGNYPELATFTWGDQVWNVMDALQKAGLPEMENPALGWKVELANFDGQNPHSHAKFLIIDGESVMAAGFNYSYLHFSRNHPSGLGVSLVDYGMVMRGPVAQDALADYDDLWEGSNLVQCPGLNPPRGDWARYCHEARGAAAATHVPEVKLYHTTPADDIAFSLLRTSNRPESDKALDALIRSAQDHIDIFEVNFSMELYCSLGVIMDDFCSMQDSLDYMQALLDVMERNHVHIRVLTTDVNMNGIENSVAIESFSKELARRGLSDLAEFRYYEGRLHAKAFLVDDAFLAVGSQNFHYSAWGDGRGLVEYNLATDSDAAISQFRQSFEYFWAHSKPVIPGEVRTE